MSEPRFAPAGDAAVLVSWGVGDRIDPALNTQAHALADGLRGRPGLAEAVPGYATLLIHYQPEWLDYEAACAEVRRVLAALDTTAVEAGPVVEIPVAYTGPDLDFVAAHCGLSVPEVITLHTSVEYRVYMMGFTPGFAYLGETDARLAVPRLETPRLQVPAGSVGIAGRQTGIYPLTSPGGWRLLGHTPVRPFDLTRPQPFALQPGDRVRFVPAPEEA